MGKSVYERVKDLEAYIPQLDAAQTDNAQRLLHLIYYLALQHNRLVDYLNDKGQLGIGSKYRADIKEELNDYLS